MEKRTRMNPRPGGRIQRGVWAALLCAVLCVLLCGCQSAAEPETTEVQEPAIQAAPVPEPEPEPAAVCIIFGIFGYILIAALPDLELRAALENIEKKLAKDKNDNYLPRSSSSSNSNCTIKSLSEMTPLADYWTCKYCGLENPKEARYCQHCGEYR